VIYTLRRGYIHSWSRCRKAVSFQPFCRHRYICEWIPNICFAKKSQLGGQETCRKRNSSNFTHWLKKLLSTSYECLALLHSATEELVVYFEGCVATFATISMIRLLKNFATKLLVILLNVDEYWIKTSMMILLRCPWWFCWDVYDDFVEMSMMILLRCLWWFCWDVHDDSVEMSMMILLRCPWWFCWDVYDDFERCPCLLAIDVVRRHEFKSVSVSQSVSQWEDTPVTETTCRDSTIYDICTCIYFAQIRTPRYNAN
jgi:hypothetical protein